MAISTAELKRKVFHNLALIYMAMYAFLPRQLTLSVLGIALVIVSAVEFLRLRRPELNAWFLNRFGGIHRESEVMNPSGVVWTLLGCWLTMLVFPERRVVLPALGFMALGDTAALGGQKWGTHHWKRNPSKTYEGSLCFMVVSAVCALLFGFHWYVAIPAAAAIAWLEAQRLPWNDNLWTPFVAALALCGFNLVLGRH